MKELSQEDIDYLNRLAIENNCKLYLPPLEDYRHPFFVVNEIFNINLFSMMLYASGYSFVFKDEKYLMIIGS